ncbi:uncharacterized protein DS421_10g288100 [Arachis hypogaea]|nr:uncharacterized protein DS421_10g288100 [Arachis hypogaea]
MSHHQSADVASVCHAGGVQRLSELANFQFVPMLQSIFIAKLENVVNGSETLMARMSDKDGIDSMMLGWSFDEVDEDIVDSQMERAR